MEDKGINTIINHTKLIIIIIAIMLIISIFSFHIYNNYMINKNENNLKNYLNENGYKNKNNTYYKTINNNGKTENYIFSIKANKFTKNIESNNNSNNEKIIIQYNGTKNITTKLYITNNTHTSIYKIEQTATYNIDTNKFECHIISISGNIKPKCSTIKKENKIFAEEIKNILLEANINNLFTTKNSNDI